MKQLLSLHHRINHLHRHHSKIPCRTGQSLRFKYFLFVRLLELHQSRFGSWTKIGRFMSRRTGGFLGDNESLGLAAVSYIRFIQTGNLSD